jgi:hypothetical protein
MLAALRKAGPRSMRLTKSSLTKSPRIFANQLIAGGTAVPGA